MGAPASHELSTLESVIDEAPVLSPAMLRMLREAAADILCPVGIALSAALPRGSAPRAVRELAMSEKGRRALASGAVRGVAKQVLERLERGPATPATLARAVPKAQTLLVTLERDGLLGRAIGERAPSARARRERVARLTPGVDVEATCTGPLGRAPKQAELLRHLNGIYFRTRGPNRTERKQRTGGRADDHLLFKRTSH